MQELWLTVKQWKEMERDQVGTTLEVFCPTYPDMTTVSVCMPQNAATRDAHRLLAAAQMLENIFSESVLAGVGV